MNSLSIEHTTVPVYIIITNKHVMQSLYNYMSIQNLQLLIKLLSLWATKVIIMLLLI